MVNPDQIQFPCIHCGKSLRVKRSLSGRRVRCSHEDCGQVVTVPADAALSSTKTTGQSSQDESERLLAFYAYDPDPNPFVFFLFTALILLPLLATISLVPWLMFRFDLFEARYMLPAMLAGPMFSAVVYAIWRKLYKHVPVVQLVPRLLEQMHGRGGDIDTKIARRVREIGDMAYWTDGVELMWKVCATAGDMRLKEAWVGVSGWPESCTDYLVGKLCDLLIAHVHDADEPQIITKDRIQTLGTEIHQFGDIDLMKKVYGLVCERGVYFSDYLWNGIGTWDGTSRCDLCDGPAGPFSRRLSPGQFRCAVQEGLLPPDTMINVGMGLGLSEEECRAQWIRSVMSDETNWVLCQKCLTKVQ